MADENSPGDPGLTILEKEFKFLNDRLGALEVDVREQFKTIINSSFKKSDVLKFLAPIFGTILAFIAWFIADTISTKKYIQQQVDDYYKGTITNQITSDIDKKVSPDAVGSLIDKEVKKNISNINSASDDAVDKALKKAMGSQFEVGVNRLADAASNFVIDSGFFLCGPGRRPNNPLADNLSDDKAIVFTKDIQFQKTFHRAPSVVVSLNSLEATATSNNKFAVWVDADPITNAGFKFVMKSLMEDIHNCKVHWIAVDEFSSEGVALVTPP